MANLKPSKKRAIFQRDRYICQYCGVACYDPLDRDKHDSVLKMATVDHIKSRGNGGDNHPNNLKTACWKCNNEKGKKEYVLVYSTKKLPLSNRRRVNRKYPQIKTPTDPKLVITVDYEGDWL